MANQWNLSGTYFETCNCEVACPCVFLSLAWELSEKNGFYSPFSYAGP